MYLNTNQTIPQALNDFGMNNRRKVAFEAVKLDDLDQATLFPDGGARHREKIRYPELLQRVFRLAHFIGSLDLAPHSNIGIMSANRGEWIECDFAIMTAGATTVPLDPWVPAQLNGYTIFTTGIELLFVENQSQFDKVAALIDSPFFLPQSEAHPESFETIKPKKIVVFEDVVCPPFLNHIVVNYRDILNDQRFSSNAPSILADGDPDTLASIVPTSGTTGIQKGVEVRHVNLLSNVRQVLESDIVKETSRVLLPLPMVHLFARLIEMVGLLTPAKLILPAITSRYESRLSDIQRASMSRDMRESGASIIPLAPRILERARDVILARVDEIDRRRVERAAQLQSESGWTRVTRPIRAPLEYVGDVKSALNFLQSSNGARSSQVLEDDPTEGGKTAPLLERFRSWVVARKIAHGLFGSSFEYAICGGAKLSREVEQFFSRLGLTIFQGYGLTEAAVATHLNRPGKNRSGSVGCKLADDIEVRIVTQQPSESDGSIPGDVGEIWLKGPNIAQGYWNSPKLSQRRWTSDGWLQTGDLGYVDRDGYLFVVDRIDDVFKLSSGEKVAPTKIEEHLKRDQMIGEALVYGAGQPFCIALVVPRPRELDVSKSQVSYEDLSRKPEDDLQDQILSRIKEINSKLPSIFKIRNIVLIPADSLTIDSNLMTGIFKLKRAAIFARFKHEIEEAYRQGPAI